MYAITSTVYELQPVGEDSHRRYVRRGDTAYNFRNLYISTLFLHTRAGINLKLSY
jgi:hypothetical protein